MDKGWIKLHRSITENHLLWHDEQCWVLFTKMLLSVGRQKGEISGGRKALAKRFNMDEYVFYRTVRRLEKEQIIHIKSHANYTVYTICNWRKYQQVDAQPSAHYPHNGRTAPTHLYKKENREKEVSSNLILEKKEQPLASPETRQRVRDLLIKKGIVRA